VVIGSGAPHLPGAGLDHVAATPVQRRDRADFQLRTPQWTMGKNFDGTGSFGRGW